VSITPEFIERHMKNRTYFKKGRMGENFSWVGLGGNPSVTLEFIERHLDKPWDWGHWSMSLNPNLTLEFIERHFDKHWSWGGLSLNTFENHPVIKKKRKLKRVQERIAFMSCKDLLPLDIMRHIVLFV
jgi:hypothetical protein